MTQQHAELLQRLSKAKVSLILEHPFVGSIAMNMPFIIDDTINPPTALTDGREVRFHPDFCNSLTQSELTFLVAHECMHPMLEHTIRRNNRDPKTWNYAADYVINKLLVDEKIGTMPKRGLLDHDIYRDGGGTAEGIYDYIYQKDDGSLPGHPIPRPGSPDPDSDGPGSNPDAPGPLDNCTEPADLSSEDEAIWRVRVAQAAQAARMVGKLSANMKRVVQEVLNPKVDWRDVLHRFVQKVRTDDRTWARPNRRFISQGVYLPSITGEQLGEIVFAVDCSGSVSPKELDQFAAELRTVQEDLRPAQMHVIYFDSKVCRVDTFGPDDAIEVKPAGGGGTRFSPVFEHISEAGINPVACVFLTDLECNDFGSVPDYPVLWVCTASKGSAPFGDVVFM